MSGLHVNSLKLTMYSLYIKCMNTTNPHFGHTIYLCVPHDSHSQKRFPRISLDVTNRLVFLLWRPNVLSDKINFKILIALKKEENWEILLFILY
jgi:hypothetical protein